MSNTVALYTIAKNFPFKKKLSLCKEDQEDMVAVMIHQVNHSAKEERCLLAARYMVGIYTDFDHYFAAIFWEKIKKNPFTGKFYNYEFFGRTPAGIIKDIKKK